MRLHFARKEHRIQFFSSFFSCEIMSHVNVALVPVRCNELAEPIAATCAVAHSKRFYIGSRSTATCVHLIEASLQRQKARTSISRPNHLTSDKAHKLIKLRSRQLCKLVLRFRCQLAKSLTRFKNLHVKKI